MTFKISLLSTFFLIVSCVAFASEKSQSVWQSKTVNQWVKVIDASISEVKGKKPTVREQWYAAYALGKYGKEAQSAVPVLLKRLELPIEKDEDVHACILYSLAEIGNPSAVPAILRYTDSELLILQRTAILVLRKFPQEIQGEKALIEKLERLLTAQSNVDFPLKVNCAATLWKIGKEEIVWDWLTTSLKLDGEFNYVRNTEIYQTLSAIHLILNDSGQEAFGEKTSVLAETLTQLIAKSPDADSVLSACDVLVILGPAALPAIEGTPDYTKNPRLLSVLASIDSESESTQKLILDLLKDGSADVLCRIAAIRGVLCFPDSAHSQVTNELVEVLNDSSTDSVIANEARLVLKKLERTEPACSKTF